MPNKKPRKRRKTAQEGDRAPLGMRKRLRMLVELIGTQEKAGVIAGVSGEQIGRWLNGHAGPKFVGVARIAQAVGRSLDWIAFVDHEGFAIERRGFEESSVTTRIRERLGNESPEECGRRLGIEEVTIQRALLGDTDSAVKLAAATGWSLDWLLLGREDGGSYEKRPDVSDGKAKEVPPLEQLVHEAVMEVDRQAAERGFTLDSEDRAGMVASYFRVLRKNRGGRKVNR